MKDAYKAEVVKEAIRSMLIDDFSLTRLKNDNGKAINLDIEVLEMIRDYYLGKPKHYSRNPLDDIEAELEEED